MAPTFRHGKDARVVVNQANLSQILNDASVANGVDKAETSVFGQSVKSYMVGLSDATVTYSGLFDGSTSSALGATPKMHQVLYDIAGTTSVAVNTYMPEGDTIGRRAMLFSGVVTNLSLNTPQADVVSCEFEQSVSGTFTAGEVLKDFTNQVTAASTFAVVDGVKASTRGWAVHGHVVGFATTGVWTFKVQHSSGGAYTDLTTARALSNATRYVRVTGTGACKRYLKAILTAKTGGNANLLVAYGRTY